MRIVEEEIGSSASIRHARDAEELATLIPRAVAVVDASLTIPLTKQLLARAENLRIISCAATGTDHIDKQTADAKGIVVRSIAEDRALIEGLTPAAEMSWGLLLACARNMVAAHLDVIDGNWRRERFPGVMLRGKQLGIIGCGRIGRWMAKYARAFEMVVVGHDPYVDPWPQGVTEMPLRMLVETSDFITLHIPANESTAGLMNSDLIGRTKRGCILVNTSRGSVVDEEALVRALEEGRVAAVGADVLQGEPQIGLNPLLKYAQTHSNVVLTPHCGGYSLDALAIAVHRAAVKVRAYLDT